jgi:hypothetical protein
MEVVSSPNMQHSQSKHRLKQASIACPLVCAAVDVEVDSSLCHLLVIVHKLQVENAPLSSCHCTQA